MFKENKYEVLGKEFYSLIENLQVHHQSLADKCQIGFLMSLIKNNTNISTVLEIGVYNGVTSLCMLKAGLLQNTNFKLYGIDKSNDNGFIGQAVRESSIKKEKDAYILNINKTSFDIESILPQNTKLDLVFIDGGHSHPWPLMDLIHVIPFLHDDAIIVLHDVIDYYRPNAWGESFIFESWTSSKYRIYDYDNNIYSNMGCIKIHKNRDELLSNLNIIAQQGFRANPWAIYMYDNKNLTINNHKDDSKYGLAFDKADILNLKLFLEKHFTKSFSNLLISTLELNLSDYIKNCYLYIHETRFLNYMFTSLNNINAEIFNRLNQIEAQYTAKPAGVENNYSILEHKLNKIINTLAWWIPVRKWRDAFRAKFM